jgi:hypothetical protein
MLPFMCIAGNRLTEPISCLAVDNAFVFVGSGTEIFAFVQGRQVTTLKIFVSCEQTNYVYSHLVQSAYRCFGYMML